MEVRADEPYFICHENYYDHLLEKLRCLAGLMDTYLVLTGNEIASVHGFVLSALTGCMQGVPHPISSATYLLLRELEPWSVKCLLEYFYCGNLAVPKTNLPNMNRILHVLDVSLGNEFYETEDMVHFTLNPTIKFNILNKIWISRSENYDVKILTEGMIETFAHSAVLSASSDQLSTLFRAQGAKPSLIVLLDFQFQDVECVLKFCYKGEVEIQRGRTTQVCQLAKILGIKDLYNTVSNLGHNFKNLNEINHDNTKLITKISCWEHKETTQKIFTTLFEKESLSDIQLICSDHTFKVHSAVLNLSPYFKALFELSDWRHSLVFLSRLSLDTVQAFVDYMYYGEVLFPGGVPEFTQAMNGLIDFSVLPVNIVEPQTNPQSWNIPEMTKPPVEEFIVPKPLEHHPEFAPSEVFDEKTSPAVYPPHVKTPTPIKHLTYTCDICAAVFFSRRSLKTHLNNHPETKRTKCQYCDQEFHKPGLRKSHEKTHTPRTHVCHCGKSYASLSGLGKHVKIVHGEGVRYFECAVCSRKCTRKEYLEEHVRTHTGSKPFPCTVCGKRFVGKTGLNHHLKVHGPAKKDSVCEVCGKAFTRKALWTHMKSHDKQYKCESCNKNFSTPAVLRAHIAMSHVSTKSYPCSICGNKFALQNHLNRHLKNVHNPAREFSCSFCPKMFSSEVKLQSHEKSAHLETSPKKMKCETCDRQFAGRSALIYHRRTHTGQRPHACHVCPKTFLRPDALQKHIRSHSHERPYKCEFCDTKCSSKSALNKHVKRHATKLVEGGMELQSTMEQSSPQIIQVLVPRAADGNLTQQQGDDQYIEVFLPPSLTDHTTF